MSLESARRVLRIEADAIEGLLARLDKTFDRAVEILLACSIRCHPINDGGALSAGRD